MRNARGNNTACWFFIVLSIRKPSVIYIKWRANDELVDARMSDSVRSLMSTKCRINIACLITLCLSWCDVAYGLPDPSIPLPPLAQFWTQVSYSVLAEFSQLVFLSPEKRPHLVNVASRFCAQAVGQSCTGLVVALFARDARIFPAKRRMASSKSGSKRRVVVLIMCKSFRYHLGMV